MNRKSIFALIVVLVAGGLVVALRRHGSDPASSGDDDNVPTLVSVQVGHLSRATLHAYVTGYASVEPAPASGRTAAATARVAPFTAGVVTRVYVSDGEEVARGAPLVDLDDRAARVAVQYAEDAARRQKTLYSEHNTSLKALQDAEGQLATAQAQLALLHITAPLAGTVTHVNVRPGEAVDLSTVLATITDLKRLVVSTQIPSIEAGALKLGEPVELLGIKAAPTSIDYVSPTVDPANDTVTVRAPLPAGTDLRAGMIVRLRITTATKTDCLAAPAESVVTHESGQSDISIVNQNEATRVPVKTGFREGDLVEVSGPGLKPGETVVTVGAYGLPAKTQIKVVQP